MNIGEVFLQLYNTGLLALAIMALAIAITIHAQIQHRIRK